MGIGERESAIQKTMQGLGEILDILDGCPWVASCTCGWRGKAFASEADAALDMWARHPAPCRLPRATEP